MSLTFKFRFLQIPKLLNWNLLFKLSCINFDDNTCFLLQMKAHLHWPLECNNGTLSLGYGLLISFLERKITVSGAGVILCWSLLPCWIPRDGAPSSKSNAVLFYILLLENFWVRFYFFKWCFLVGSNEHS